MNFSLWPFLWFGLPGRLLKMGTDPGNGFPENPRSNHPFKVPKRNGLVARLCELSRCAIAIVHRLMFFLYRRVSRYALPGLPRLGYRKIMLEACC